MAQPDPGQQSWLIGAGLLIVGGVSSAITTAVAGWFNRRNNEAAAAKALAEAGKARAEGETLQVTAQIELSEAAMSLVSGLREELNRMRAAHADEIREIREAHAREMSTLRDNHARELAVLQKELDESERDRRLLAAKCEGLEARINAAGLPLAPVLTSMPEVDL